MDTSAYLTLAIVGLGAGAVYAAIALGVVVVYKGTGIINFAQAAMAMWAAYVFDELVKTGTYVLPIGSIPVGRDVRVALMLALLTSMVLGWLVYALVLRPLRTAPPLAKVVACVGTMIVLQAMVVLRFSAEARVVRPVLPGGSFAWGDVIVPQDRPYLVGAVVLAASGLYVFYRHTRAGLATRAAAESEINASLTGYSPAVLAGLSFVMSSGIVALIAILGAPVTGLSPSYTLLIVPALAAALMGRFTTVWVVGLAGLALGAFQGVINLMIARNDWPGWASVGLTEAIPFVVIVTALALNGRNLPGRGSVEVDDLPSVPRIKHPYRAAIFGGALGLVMLLLTSGSYRFGLVTSMIVMIILLSLVVLTGYVGQISLAQAALAGSGGFVLSHVFDGRLPFPLALLAAGTTTALIGVAVGLPALRLRGAQLAVVTLAGAVTVEQFVFRNPSITSATGSPVSPPSLFGIDLSIRDSTDLARLPFGITVLVVLLCVALMIAKIGRGRVGQRLLAVRSNERAAAAVGINVAGTKVLAFGISSFIAGLGGCLIGYSRQQLSADSFGVLVGISFVAFAYLGGITRISGAVIGGMLAPLGIGYVVLDRLIHFGEYYLLVTGLTLVLTAILNPNGIAGEVSHVWSRMRARRRRPDPASLVRHPPPPATDDAGGYVSTLGGVPHE